MAGHDLYGFGAAIVGFLLLAEWFISGGGGILYPVSAAMLMLLGIAILNEYNYFEVYNRG